MNKNIKFSMQVLKEEVRTGEPLPNDALKEWQESLEEKYGGAVSIGSVTTYIPMLTKDGG